MTKVFSTRKESFIMTFSAIENGLQTLAAAIEKEAAQGKVGG
jgi:hypothetical protein